MKSQNGSLPARNAIDPKYKWRLEDIYPSDETWEYDFERAKVLIQKLGSLESEMAASASSLLKILQARDEAFQVSTRLYTYARMRLDEANTNVRYQAMKDRAETLMVQAESAAAYIVPGLLALPEEKLKNFLDENEELRLYEHFLDDIGRHRDHTRPIPEEKLLAEAGEIAQAPGNIFRMLNDADIKFGSIVDESGETVELTKGRYIYFLESRDRRVRKSAFEALSDEYGKYQNTWASILSANVRKNVFFARVHNYPSALEAALHGDNIPVEVYTNLITTIHERMDLMHRYVSLRKRLLGLDELHMYDLYAPIIKEVEFKIPYEEAKLYVRNALKPLGEDYLRTLEEGLEGGWIDVWENQGKTSGAYSWGAYGVHPYVLLNYQPNLDNAFTLAHELGHALHTHYSNASQPFVYAEYPIFLAEVASTLNEALLLTYLLGVTEEVNRRLYLLNYYCEQFRGTVYRQVMFAEFEKAIHETVERGEALTPEFLSNLYHELNVKYYGPEIVVDPQIDMEWARIPHFYMGFYVYKYATGFSAATALSRQVLDEGQPAVERYLQFLKGGNSNYPIELLKQAGVDMTTPRPVHQALDVFEKTLQELEALA